MRALTMKLYTQRDVTCALVVERASKKDNKCMMQTNTEMKQDWKNTTGNAQQEATVEI